MIRRYLARRRERQAQEIASLEERSPFDPQRVRYHLNTYGNFPPGHPHRLAEAFPPRIRRGPHWRRRY